MAKGWLGKILQGGCVDDGVGFDEEVNEKVDEDVALAWVGWESSANRRNQFLSEGSPVDQGGGETEAPHSVPDCRAHAAQQLFALFQPVITTSCSPRKLFAGGGGSVQVEAPQRGDATQQLVHYCLEGSAP